MEDIRITKSTKIDTKLTELLSIADVAVISTSIKSFNNTASRGGTNNRRKFLSFDSDRSKAECEECKELAEKHRYFKKEYVDCIINEDGVYEYIILDFRFLKFICRNHDTMRVFSKPYYFAERDANITNRMESRIIYLAMRTSCFDAARLIDYSVSRQAIGTIVKKWTERCDIYRDEFITPADLVIMSATNTDTGYIFFADISYNKFRIFEVVPLVDSASIISVLNKLNIDKIQNVVTDSNTILVDTLRSTLPDRISLIIDANALIQPLLDNLEKYLNKYARQIEHRTKGYFLLPQNAVQPGSRIRMAEAMASRPELEKIYNHIILLRDIVKSEIHDDYSSFEKWNENIPEVTLADREEDQDFSIFDDVSVYIDDYMTEIMNFYKRRNIVDADVFQKIKILSDRLSNWSDRAPELMRARVLYSKFVDDCQEIGEQQWRGISYDDLLQNIDELIREGGKL